MIDLNIHTKKFKKCNQNLNATENVCIKKNMNIEELLVAYEVSVSNLEINNKEDNEKEVEETNQEAM